MRKICIVTVFNSNNYGTRLQSYALGAYLSGKGADVYYLKRFRVLSWYFKHPVLLFARVRNKLFSRERKRFFSPSPYVISEERKARLDAFTEENYVSVAYNNSSDWHVAIDEGIVFMSGSDIIWQPAWGYPSKYFLDFAVYANLPCFSYASSLGAKELPKKYYRAYKRYLGRFCNVGVREEAAARLLEPIVGRHITKVADPTLLLDIDVWDTFADKARLSIDVGDRPYALCYFVMDDERYWRYMRSVREETGLQIVVIPMHRRDEDEPYIVLQDGTPYEFVWLIKNAELVVTDSFHACCFSMQYEREFYLLRRVRPDEDDKYDDFLSRYGLRNRVVLGDTFVRDDGIDYGPAKVQLAEDRRFSLEFLENALQYVR